ncbi:MAG: hypothetical protein ABI625_16400, partial [bacterium]
MSHHLRQMPTFRRVLSVALLALGAASTHAAAQQQLLTVTVTDSASHRPLSSAVLIFLDASGTAFARNITNERGQLSASVSPDVRRVRALRLGYRARDVQMPSTSAATARLDIAMLAIPALLEPVTVVAASSCPRRDDSRAALALLEQARAGLLATIVAREANPAEMKLLSYERTMDGNSDRIERQSVHIDSVGHRAKSYEAAATASDFVENGFSRDSAGMRYFFGPDADVLLDEGFSNGYCFRIHDSERTRPNQVGLEFSAADKKKGRVDIEGALWIDTVAHTLKDINFRFIIYPHVSGVPDQGGQVSFREMPNGMVLIDRWLLRLAAVHSDTSYARGMQVRRFYFAREVGGEVARAIWPDGRAWKASLGTVQLHVVTQQGEPARSAIIRLDDTDYIGSPDATGDLEITDVLPGPYDVIMIDTALAPMGISLGAGLKLYAQRDSTIRAPLIEPPRDAFLKKHCGKSTERHWVTVRVYRPDGASVVDGTWELGEDFGTSLEFMHARGRTGLDGEFGFCSDAPHGAGP